MIADERVEIGELRLRRILKARSEDASSKDIRIFHLPNLNFDAKDYIYIIYIPWQEYKVTESPILSRLSYDELNYYKFPKLETYPCPSQSVEQCVKLITEASALVYGAETQDGFIQARVEQKCMTFFKLKQILLQK